MKTTLVTTVAILATLLLPSLAGATPLRDAYLRDEFAVHLMVHGSDWPVEPDRLTAVAFTAQNTLPLLSIDLWLAARAPAGEKGQPQPVAVELWQGDALLGTDAAGADVPFVWRGDLWNGQFPFNSGWPQGYNPHSFAFPGVTLTAGETYEFRVTAAASGTWLMTDSLGLSQGNVAYTVWVDASAPEPAGWVLGLVGLGLAALFNRCRR